MYHIGDYWRFIWHRGEKVVFWCGGDILNLKSHKIWSKWIFKLKAKHLCENDVELLELANSNILATVAPMCFEPFDDIKLSYKHSPTPHVYLCCHPGYKEFYGVNMIEGFSATIPEITFHIYGANGVSHHNIIYHGQVSNKQFNEEIKNYQAGLRLNDFDGFGEILAKSILMGQWPISRIYYPFIDYAHDMTSLINHLKKLKYQKEPNIPGREYWSKKLKHNPFI